MGGSSYDRDVGRSSSSGGFSYGSTSSSGAKRAMGRRSIHKDINPYERSITSNAESPIIVALDVTGSNIEFAHIVYDKAPMLYGQIEQKGYLKDFDICFCAVGDAYCDRAPLQVCDFKKGIELDEELKKIFLEGGGGGQLMETYELAAYYFTHFCDMPNAKLPFLLMIGDEAPYPTLESSILEDVVGKKVQSDIDTRIVLEDALNKFQGNVFYFQNPYCGRPVESRAETKRVNQEWKQYFGPGNEEKVISIYEEKSIVDIILGVIAMVSRARNLQTYKLDLINRGQTKTRIASVDKSLGDFTTAIVPVVDGKDLPVVKNGKKCKSGAKRI